MNVQNLSCWNLSSFRWAPCGRRDFGNLLTRLHPNGLCVCPSWPFHPIFGTITSPGLHFRDKPRLFRNPRLSHRVIGMGLHHNEKGW